MKHCPYCNTDYAVSLNACPSCNGAAPITRCDYCGNIHSSTICPNCGFGIYDTLRTCPRCGSLAKDRICHRCGDDIAHNASFRGAATAVASKAACKITGHQWWGCKCTRCGQTRDEGHQFQPIAGRCEQRCVVCGISEPLPHFWQGAQCRRCGATKKVTDKFWDFVGKRLPFLHVEEKKNRSLASLGMGLIVLFLIFGIVAVLENTQSDSNALPSSAMVNAPIMEQHETSQIAEEQTIESPEPETSGLLKVPSTEASSNGIAEPLPVVNTGLIIEYDSNLLMNIYDVRISLDDSVLGTQTQGTKKVYELSLTEGAHAVTLVEVGDDKNIQTVEIIISKDHYNYLFVKTRNSGIEVEKQDVVTYDEAQLLVGSADYNDDAAENESTSPSEAPLSIVEPTPSVMQSPETAQPEMTSDNGNEGVEDIDLDGINATNSADFDRNYLGATYRIKGVVGEAAAPDEVISEAMVIIRPTVMARGMGGSDDLEINIWMTADMFNIIGGKSSVGNEVEITATLSSISRNATSSDPAIKGYPIQLECNATKVVLLSSGNTDSATSDDEKSPSGISLWDGDHTELKKLIIANLNDEDSYKHVETTWRYIEDSKIQQEINDLITSIGWSGNISVGDFLIISEFSCKNVYNATVKSKAYGIEYKNGNVMLLGIH